MEGLLATVPAYDRYLSYDAMRHHTESLCTDSRFRAETIGRSAQGLPIDLLHLPRGRDRTAFLWGFEDPSEPICSLTMTWLCDQLAAGNQELDHFDCNWAFIRCIDPDGARRNEGWFAAPGDIDAFFRHGWEPFATSSKFWEPKETDPEVAALRSALRLLQPDLLFPMHDESHFISEGYCLGLSEERDPSDFAAHFAFIRSLGMPLREQPMWEPSMLRNANWAYAAIFDSRPQSTVMMNEACAYAISDRPAGSGSIFPQLTVYRQALRDLHWPDQALISGIESHLQFIRWHLEEFIYMMKKYCLAGRGLELLREHGDASAADELESSLYRFIREVVGMKEIRRIPVQYQVQAQLHFLFTVLQQKGYLAS